MSGWKLLENPRRAKATGTGSADLAPVIVK